MDVYCPKCGEPWDIDTFHDAAEEQGVTFKDVQRRFFGAEGCKALGGTCSETPVNPAYASASAALYEVLGDDIDGIASESDFGATFFMGADE